MKKVLKKHKVKLQFAAPVLVVGALSFALFSFGGNSGALIQDTEPFVLIAQNSIRLSKDTQISSGDIASNKSIHIVENGIVNGDLYSDRIQLVNNTSINGNVTSNKLIKAKTAEVFGEITNTIQKNIVELPQVPNFQTGSLSHIVTEDTTLNPGNYDSITINENAILTLTPGLYNLNKLILEDNSKLLYSDATTVNVKDQIKIQNNTLVVSNNSDSTSTTELQLNYTGKPPLTIGDSSFVTAKILSPDSRVHLGNKATFRGQILAKDINVGEEGILSKGLSFMQSPSAENIVADPGVGTYPVNELLLNLNADATYADAVEIASIVGGRIVGQVSSINLYQIVFDIETISALEEKLNILQNLNNPKVEGVLRNLNILIQ